MIQNLLGHLALHRNLLGLLVLGYRFLLHGLREYLKYPEIFRLDFLWARDNVCGQYP